MDCKRILVQRALLMQRAPIGSMDTDINRHVRDKTYSQTASGKLENLMSQAFVSGDAARWARLCEFAYDRMTVEELKADSVAIDLLRTLFGVRDSGETHFSFDDAHNLAEIASNIYDLVTKQVEGPCVTGPRRNSNHHQTSRLKTG